MAKLQKKGLARLLTQCAIWIPLTLNDCERKLYVKKDDLIKHPFDHLYIQTNSFGIDYFGNVEC